MDKSITQLAEIIEQSSNIVFFGGAGVSTESGIPDYRSTSGLYNESEESDNLPKILTHTLFVDTPEIFYQVYRSKRIYPQAKPNLAHEALVRMEQAGKLKAIITQNIDTLHQMAGSKNVIELHGSIRHNYCTQCNKHFDLSYIIASSLLVPHCDECNGTLKPDVVLYEERLSECVINQAISYIRNAEVLIVGGTSLNVYPAASYLRYFTGNHLVLINKSATEYDDQATLVIRQSIGQTLSLVS